MPQTPILLTPRKIISELAARSAAPPSKALPYTRRPRALSALCLSKLRTLAEICSTDDTPDLQKPRISASPICTVVWALSCLVSECRNGCISQLRPEQWHAQTCKDYIQTARYACEWVKAHEPPTTLPPPLAPQGKMHATPGQLQ